MPMRIKKSPQNFTQEYL